jgi:flagellar motor switch protein FliG
MLGQADQKQDAEAARLVTVYSKMKPKDAAAIMVQLEDKVRLPVAAKMKEALLAQVLANMPPAEAKKLTEKLAARFTPSPALTQKVADADNAKVTPAAPPAAAKASVRAPVRRAPRRPVVKAALSSADKPAEKIPAKVEAKPAAPKPAAVKPPVAPAAKPAVTPAKSVGPSA